jgi:hypothetical protein
MAQINLKEIQEIVTDQTAKCSAIGRQIALGLTTVTWALFFSGEKFTSNYLLITALFAEMLFFLLDFTQYFFMLVSYKKLYTKSVRVLDGRDDTVKDSDLEYAILCVKNETNRKGFIFFFSKYPFIVISFVSLSLYIIMKIKEANAVL